MWNLRICNSVKHTNAFMLIRRGVKTWKDANTVGLVFGTAFISLYQTWQVITTFKHVSGSNLIGISPGNYLAAVVSHLYPDAFSFNLVSGCSLKTTDTLFKYMASVGWNNLSSFFLNVNVLSHKSRLSHDVSRGCVYILTYNKQKCFFISHLWQWTDSLWVLECVSFLERCQLCGHFMGAAELLCITLRSVSTNQTDINGVEKMPYTPLNITQYCPNLNYSL